MVSAIHGLYCASHPIHGRAARDTFFRASLASGVFLWLLVGLCAAAPPAAARIAKTYWDPSKMEEVDGRKQPPEKQWPKSDVVKRWRPWGIDDDGGECLVENLRVHHVTNQKAIDIGLVSSDRVPGKTLNYARVTVRNCDISEIKRDEMGQIRGLHIDFLRICGGGDAQPKETDVLIEDVYIHDGSALPLIIQDGKFRSITLRRIRVENTTLGGAQLSFINTGYVKDVLVDQCPGLGVALMGRPGTIQRCIVRDSAGARVSDVRTINGNSGVTITEENTGIRPNGPVRLPATAASKPVATVKPKLTLSGDIARGQVHCVLSGDLPEDVLHVRFLAWDKDDYQVGREVIVMNPPWEADLKLTRLGPISVTAVIRRTGGDDVVKIVQTVNVTEVAPR